MVNQPPVQLIDGWIWGVDPAVSRGAIAAVSGDRFEVVSWAHFDATEPNRLDLLYQATRTIAGEFASYCPPVAVAVEQPSGRMANPILGYAVGVVQLALFHELHAMVFTVTSSDWKKRTVGKGNADKAGVMAWAKARGYEGESQDEADAIGVATAAAGLVEASPAG